MDWNDRSSAWIALMNNDSVAAGLPLHVEPDSFENSDQAVAGDLSQPQ